MLAIGLYFFAASLISFIAYWLDKRKALNNKHGNIRRIPERQLLFFDAIGGWPGGFAAQRLVRHKNRKLSYQLKFWLVVLLHLAAYAGLIYWMNYR